ncbi:hypothetical protein I3760_09G141900 [Carya illinoinensis]|nr:hypothetical protein I3760_09G141900 [Carya illinoinensis]
MDFFRFSHLWLIYSLPFEPFSALSSNRCGYRNGFYSSVQQRYIRNLRFKMSSKPYLIFTALHESHIQAAVVCAHSQNLQKKIRSAGHDYEGLSYVAKVPFFILDMFMLRSIHIDMETETAWVQTGATLGEVVYRIYEKSKTHGFPVGVCPTVGVGFSGGGYGNMMRKYGLSVDNIIDAQIVNVKGKLLDRKSMGENQFWAIRGGGGASIGVVVSYKIKIVRVPKTVTIFRVAKTLDQNAIDIVYQWQHVADKLDNNLFIRLILNVQVNETDSQKTGRATFHALFLGDTDKLLLVMKKSFPELGLKKSDCNETSWAQSVLIFWTKSTLGTANVHDLLNRTQDLVYFKRKSDNLKKPISKDGLEVIWKRLIELQNVALTFNPYGGRMAEILAEESRFPHRAGNLAKIQYAVDWHEAGKEDYYINLTRKLYSYTTHMCPRIQEWHFSTTKILTWVSITTERTVTRKEKFMESSISRVISRGW